MFGQFLEDEAKGLHDLDGDALKVALVKATWTPNTSTNTVWSDISSHEVSGSGNGYAQQTIVGQVTRSGITVTFDGNDVDFTANGGAIEDARYAVLYNDAGDRLIAYCLLDDTPADVDIPDGVKLRIRMHASGIGQKAPA